MAVRILASVILLLSILFMPYWLSVALAFLGMMYFPLYAEAVVLLSLSDLLYGVIEDRFFGIMFVSFIIAIALIISAEFFKRKLKFYP